ncbi:GspE/PulE family protein [Fibrobacter sp. UWB12]|uniref:GspE/PulE family protein n=1 Tax=Fibrobacter sp. UWB12 TaxID=1896203 RepID=UPI0009331C4C|nr:GspE/PulE family protein [Fibrobacter sp. UWB12]
MNTKILSKKWCQKNGIAVMAEAECCGECVMESDEKSAAPLKIAVPNASDELLLEKIRFITQQQIIPEEHTPAEIRLMHSHAESIDDEDLFKDIKQLDASRNTSWESEPIINLVDSLIVKALQKKATDIHLEPMADALRVRFRIDGLLTEYRTFPQWLAEPVLIRLKVMANVDITERRLPHDGSFAFEDFHEKVNVRLSTIPISNGEKCVLRLLPANDSAQTLASLDFSEKTLQALRRIFSAPQGLFLVTGPTGSGKTTTLYAGLREIILRKINVTTIEDPVEYELRGANQVPVNEKCGFTFAVALRSILRQDPDVILVGEIRDTETAQIAIRAAQTGHLVLSTLHTNSAKAATSRLIDLGISQSILNETLLGVFAQRLVRKLDKNESCKSTHHYKGRTVVCELLLPNNTYADGTMQENAAHLIQQEITTEEEIMRVLGL